MPSNDTMCASYSNSDASFPEEEDDFVYSDSALTRIRIFPQPELPTVGLDVRLAAHLTTSLDSFYTFINALSIMKSIPDYEVTGSPVHLLLRNRTTRETFIAGTDKGDIQFSNLMDHIWMMNERCTIYIEANLKASTSPVVTEMYSNLTLKTVESVERGGEMENNEQGVEDVTDYLDMKTETEVVNVRKDIKQDTKAKMATLQETDSQRHSAEYQKSQYDPELPSEENSRSKARSSSLPGHHSQEIKEPKKVLELGRGAGLSWSPASSTNSEPPTQARGPPSTTIESSIDDEDVQKRDERVRLQQELQKKMTNSLIARGKPTTVKSATYKAPSGFKASSGAVSQGESSRKALGTGKLSAQESGLIQGGVSIPSHLRQPYPPVTNEDWVRSRSTTAVSIGDAEDNVESAKAEENM